MMDTITTRCDEVRVAAEKRMVVVVGYLYAAKKEGDNDYHLILGSKSCSNPDCFMTAEVSGVPRIAKDRTVLARARSEFRAADRQLHVERRHAGRKRLPDVYPARPGSRDWTFVL
jgi:hypothetical protein